MYGALNLEGNPMICSNTDCQSLKEGKWELSPSLNVARGGAAMVSSVQNYENGKKYFFGFHLTLGVVGKFKASLILLVKLLA